MSTYTPLQKGAACLNCRRRKIRCDGKRPKCTSCESEVDCQYKDIDRTPIRLEDQITALETRIQELESRGQSTISKNKTNYRTLMSSKDRSSSTDLGLEDIPPVLSQMLMHNFLHKGCSIGFFLHKERFEKSMLEFEGTEMPTSALFHTSSLWGVHLSSSETSPAQEAILVSHALRSSALALSGNHPQKIIQYIQSEVLLANYFYRANRTIEGRYHTAAAASLVLSSGMHKVRTSSLDNVFGYTAFSNPLAPPSDAIEEGERINAFWTVLILDTFWNAVHGIPSSISYTTQMTRVDTPWPRMLEEYTQTPFDPLFRNSHTIERFLSGAQESSTSPKANFAKAAILFERATFTGLELINNPISWQSQASFKSLDTLIQRFIGNLLPLDHALGPPLNIQYCIHSLALAADIQLHVLFASEMRTSRTRVLKAAKAIVDLIDSWGHVPEMEFVDPMLAVLWLMTCKVFIDESTRQQVTGSLLYTRTEVRTFCKRVMIAMEGHTFPLMKHQLAIAREAFESTMHSYDTLK